MELNAKYSIDYCVAIDYLCYKLLKFWKKKVLQYYITNLTYFGNTIILHADRRHAKIKRQLNNISTGKIIMPFS